MPPAAGTPARFRLACWPTTATARRLTGQAGRWPSTSARNHSRLCNEPASWPIWRLTCPVPLSTSRRESSTGRRARPELLRFPSILPPPSNPGIRPGPDNPETDPLPVTRCDLHHETNRTAAFSVRKGRRFHLRIFNPGSLAVVDSLVLHSGLATPTALSSLASFTRADSSFFCTLATSAGSTSAAADLADCASEISHCWAARRMRPVLA